jgi:subtilisin family serine protease
MATNEHRDRPGKGDDDVPERERRQRVRDQVEIIRRRLRDRGDVRVANSTSDDDADFDYLYRGGHILVRDSDVRRVAGALGIDDPDAAVDGLVNGLTRLRLPDDLEVEAALDLLDAQVGVGVASPDHVLYVTPKITLCPATEPEVPPVLQPVPPVSAHTRDGSGVLVSVVDSGWIPAAATDPLTPWLAGVTGDEEDVDRDDIHPYAGHGTFIAGVVRCVAPSAQVRVEGFLTHGGAAFESEMIAQLCEALALGPDIISFSAGTTTRGNRPSIGFEVFYDNFLSQVKGTVFVAAAGNDSTREPFWPAAFPWAVSVGAIDATETRASFSNYGSWVDVYALGVDLVNAYPHGTFVTREPPHVGEVRHFAGLARWSGTSFSTPVVAAHIAARMSRTGLSARHAADQVLAEARARAVPGVGPII